MGTMVIIVAGRNVRVRVPPFILHSAPVIVRHRRTLLVPAAAVRIRVQSVTHSTTTAASAVHGPGIAYRAVRVVRAVRASATW